MYRTLLTDKMFLRGINSLYSALDFAMGLDRTGPRTSISFLLALVLCV